MEIAGFAVSVAGLAGLLGACIDAIDRVDTYRKFGFESRYITTQFADDKLRLHKWAENVGITNGRLQVVHHRDLDRGEVATAIVRTLVSIDEIFSETNSSSSNLQSSSIDSKSTFLTNPDNYMNDHSAEEKKSRSLASKASKLRWSLGGKARFTKQIEVFGVLVGKLYDLIPLEKNSKPVWSSESERGVQELLDRLKGKTCATTRFILCLIDLVETKKELYLWLDAVNTTDAYEKHLSARLESTCE